MSKWLPVVRPCPRFCSQHCPRRDMRISALHNSLAGWLLSAAGLVVLVMPMAGAAEEKPGGVWVEAEGVFNLGDETTMELAQRSSLEAARRAAVEKAVGMNVTGSILVRNAQLIEDLVQVVAQGLIVEEEVVDRGLQAQGPKGAHATYRTKIRAKVVRVAQGQRKTNYTVQCRLNRSVYQQGEHAEVRVKPTQDSYLYLFDITEDEHLTVLAPNRFLPEVRVAGGHDYVFPPNELVKRGIHVTTMVPAGKQRAVEHIKVIATRQPIDVLKRRAPEAIFEEYRPADTTMLVDLLKTLAGLDPGEWAECAAAYEIVTQ